MEPLVEAGLDSVPGGGGEIFADAVRKIGLGQCTAEAWLTVMRVAHELGLNTSATMMFDIEASAIGSTTWTWSDDGRTRRSPISPTRRPLPRLHLVAVPARPHPLGRLKGWGDVEGDDVAPFPGDAVARLDGSGSKSTTPSSVSAPARPCRQPPDATSVAYLDNVWSIGSSWVMGPHVGRSGSDTDERHGLGDDGGERRVLRRHDALPERAHDLPPSATRASSPPNGTTTIVLKNFGPEAPDVEDWSKFRPAKLHQQNADDDAAAAVRLQRPPATRSSTIGG